MQQEQKTSTPTSRWPEVFRLCVSRVALTWLEPGSGHRTGHENPCRAPPMLFEKTCSLQLFIPSCILSCHSFLLMSLSPSPELYKCESIDCFLTCGAAFLSSSRYGDPPFFCPLSNHQIQRASCRCCPCPLPAVLCMAYSSYLH